MSTTHHQALIAAFKSALATRDRDSVNRASTALIDAGVPLGKSWRSIAQVLEKNGEFESAFRAVDTWRAQAGDLPEIIFEQSGVRARGGRLAEADAFLGQIPEAFWNPGGRAYLNGTLATNLGDSDRARRELRKAADLDPMSGQSWLALAMVGNLDESDARALEAVEARFRSVPGNEGAAYFYGLGKLRHQRKDYDGAFAAIAEGAAKMRALKPYDRAEREATIARNMAGWTPEVIAALSEGVDTSDRASVFVTGLPRSGTTITEQILVSHSAVSEGAELSLFRLFRQDLGGLSLDALKTYLSRGGSIQRLRALYNHLARQRLGTGGLIVDKSVLASNYTGYLAVMFPEARFVWLRRDPVDTAWSDFSTFFLGGLDWSWDLGDVGHFFNLEDAQYRFWTDTLGERILTVPYAELVDDPAAWSRRITEHVGLPFEEQQLAPHLTERVVTTASAAQVREPINRKGIGSAAPYAKHMGPFFDEYRGDPTG